MPKLAQLSNRIGRFKGRVGLDDTNENQKIKIVYRPTNQLYRVINPGDRLSGDSAQTFGLKYDGLPANPSINVPISSTLDFFASEFATEIEVTHQDPLGTGLQVVRGMYALVGNDPSIPSGRFDFKDADETAHMVIDLRLAPAVRKATYRFLNSGTDDLVITVKQHAVTSPVFLAKVKKRMSVDLTLTGRQYAEVMGPCKGIYEIPRREIASKSHSAFLGWLGSGMADQKTKFTRRDFIKLSAASAAMTAAWYSTTLKTDAQVAAPAANFAGEDPIIPYMYHGEDI